MINKNKKRPIYAYINIDLYKEIENMYLLHYRDYKSISAIVNEALADWLEKNKRKEVLF